MSNNNLDLSIFMLNHHLCGICNDATITCLYYEILCYICHILPKNYRINHHL